MEFRIKIFCKYTINEIYKIMLAFKEELGELTFDNDLEFTTVTKNFRIWVEDDPDELEFGIDFLNGTFMNNVGVMPILDKK